jgi:dihydroflavonol-4-reductase
LAHAGKLPYRALDDVGFGLVHVDDLAVGILSALDRGTPPRTYVLSGPRSNLSEAMGIAARLGGKTLPRLRLPGPLVRALAPFGRAIGQPNLREVVAATAGVTYWASSARAEAELGFQARPLEDGLRATFEAESDPLYTSS